MGEFVRVLGTTDVKPDHGIVAEGNGKTLAVFNVDGTFPYNRQHLYPWTVAREARDRRDPKFDVRGSKFRKLRTSDLEPSPVPLVSLG